MCVYVCMYVKWRPPFFHDRMCVRAYVCICVCMHVCNLSVCMYVCMYVFMCVCEARASIFHVCTCVCMRM